MKHEYFLKIFKGAQCIFRERRFYRNSYSCTVIVAPLPYKQDVLKRNKVPRMQFDARKVAT